MLRLQANLNVITKYPSSGLFRLGIINFFILIGLLRLTNLNFYLSQLIGLETEINNTGGNAFNFTNYIGISLLLLILFTKVKTLEARWRSAWPIYAIMLIYLVNAVTTPYANHVWILYQELFLLVALILHMYVQKISDDFLVRFRRVGEVIFWGGIFLTSFCLLVILLNNSWTYYLSEFNEVFVQALDDYGIMKQRFGYLLGFLVSYIFFILKGRYSKAPLLILILLAGFGIRSFVIGFAGALLIFSLRHPKYLTAYIIVSGIVLFGFLLPNLSDLIYDTRYYSFINAFDIIEKFPFGVGLGGYAVYTEEYHRLLFASFREVNAVLDYIPLAPESDLVHIFGSLGLVLGGAHLLLQLRLVYYSFSLQPLMNSFQKCILFYFCFMTFFGISEDSIFSINYWIFFGLASGIVSSLIYKKKRKTE